MVEITARETAMEVARLSNTDVLALQETKINTNYMIWEDPDNYGGNSRCPTCAGCLNSAAGLGYIARLNNDSLAGLSASGGNTCPRTKHIE